MLSTRGNWDDFNFIVKSPFYILFLGQQPNEMDVHKIFEQRTKYVPPSEERHISYKWN